MAEQDFDQQFEAQSIGDRLRLAREQKDMSLEDVASQTRIPVRHLQHIEREEWDALPAATYCIGFARNYANAVGLDGAELSRELRERIGGPRSRTPAPEYYEPADPARVPPRALALVAAIIALVLVVGYLLWRSSLGDGESANQVASVDVSVPEAKAPGQPARQPLQPQALAGQPVTLVATEEVWLRISEAGGGSIYEGIMRPGDRYQIPATAQRPVIRTGRPQVVRLVIGTRDIGPIEPVERTVSDVSLRAEDLASRLQGGAPAAAPPPPALPAPIPPQ